MAALQNGAKLFVNYCLNCHAASMMRYNRLRDIGLNEEQIKENLLFTSEKVGDLMKVAIDPVDAKAWFGVVPPDLSVMARAKSSHAGSGADYLYTYLRSFYEDKTRPTGWNNLVLPNSAMPHVLWDLQGIQKANFVEEKDPHNPEHTLKKFASFELAQAGKLDRLAFDENVADLVAYMQWMAEPVQNQRRRIGVIVLFALAIFTLLAWRLNVAYWKDVK